MSTSRAGAALVSADDGEALALNPAGIAKAKPGTTITLGIAAIDYYVKFQRAGNYPDLSAHESVPYSNTPYPAMENTSDPGFGMGPFVPVPVIAIVSDLGGALPGLHVGGGLYAPNAYPFRNFTKVNGREWVFNSDIEAPPPPTRYDIIHQEAAIILPSVMAAYRVTPDLDVGARFSAGVAHVDSTVAVWGITNHEEWQQQDAQFRLNANGFVWNAALGANFRPTEEIEVGAQYTLPMNIHASGDAQNQNGPAVTIGGATPVISPVPDSAARCAKGGTAQKLKGCVDFELPMTATVGARYKFLDKATGKLKGDVEVNVGWEHWGQSCSYKNADGSLTGCQNPSDFRVVVDAQAGTMAAPDGVALHDTMISHGLQDTYSVRLGGSYVFPMDADTSVVARGGVSYDTAAAKTGWERVDIDGAARTMLAAGASYKLKRVSIDAGVGFIYEGERTQNRNCVVTGTLTPQNLGCGPNGSQQNVPGWSDTGPFRQGPDPVNPLVNPDVQAEHPVNEGTFNSHYVLVMLGMSTWF